MPETWILASRSPRRQAFMKVLGLPHEVVVSGVAEETHEDEPPPAAAVRLALRKARTVAQKHPGRRIVAADTVVVADGVALGQPANEAEALSMLESLRGRRHQVVSGLVVWDGLAGKVVADRATSQVWMRNYGPDELKAYVQTGDPLDKAGGYAIQHGDFRPVERIEGCYASVMGFPMCHLRRAVRALGIPFDRDVPALCRRHTGHRCTIHPAVLAGEPWRCLPFPQAAAEFDPLADSQPAGG